MYPGFFGRITFLRIMLLVTITKIPANANLIPANNICEAYSPDLISSIL